MGKSFLYWRAAVEVALGSQGSDSLSGSFLGVGGRGGRLPGSLNGQRCLQPPPWLPHGRKGGSLAGPG